MTIQEFAQKVLHMRIKQQEYFRLAIEAKREPAKHMQRKKVLAESVNLENEVDELILNIITTGKEANHG